MKNRWKAVVLVLLPCVLLISGPLPGYGQDTSVSLGNTVQVGASSGGSDYSDNILIGMFVVVVGILLWLGVKEHMDEQQWSSQTDLDQATAQARTGWADHERVQFEEAFDISLQPLTVGAE